MLDLFNSFVKVCFYLTFTIDRFCRLIGMQGRWLVRCSFSSHFHFFVLLMHEVTVKYCLVLLGTIKEWVKLIWHALWGFKHLACSTYLIRSSKSVDLQPTRTTVFVDWWKLKVDGSSVVSILTLIIFLSLYCTIYPLGTIQFYLEQSNGGVNQCDTLCGDWPISHPRRA